MNETAKNVLLWVIIAVVLFTLFNSFNPRGATSSDLPYNGFVQGVGYFNQAKGAAVAVVPDAAASTDGVRKVVDAAVISAIGEAARGQFTSSPYYGTLKDGGVDIAPLDASAGDELKAEVEAVRAALINGSVTPPAAG